jgi:hypothetical protein
VTCCLLTLPLHPGVDTLVLGLTLLVSDTPTIGRLSDAEEPAQFDSESNFPILQDRELGPSLARDIHSSNARRSSAMDCGPSTGRFLVEASRLISRS